MLEAQHILDLLSPEDLEIVKLMDAKANSPDLKWSGHYREKEFIIGVVGPVDLGGRRYEAFSIVHKENWQSVYKRMIDAMCIQYPELMYNFYPEYE